MKVAVLGSGTGALAVAADMSRHGRHTVMADLVADLAGERASLESVRAAGSITVTGYGDGEGDGGDGDQHGDGTSGESDQHGAGTSGRQADTYPVDVADSVAEALAGTELAVVVAPCDARERWVRAIAPHTTPDHTVLLMGEGGGAIVARRAIEPPTVVAETNMLPHRARATGPGTVDVTAKRGGVLVASLPAAPPDTARVMELPGGSRCTQPSTTPTPPPRRPSRSQTSSQVPGGGPSRETSTCKSSTTTSPACIRRRSLGSAPTPTAAGPTGSSSSSWGRSVCNRGCEHLSLKPPDGSG